MLDILDKQEKAQDEQTSDLLGYRLNSFNTIEKNLDGIQEGLYLVGGYSNVGKTNFLINLFLDVVESNNNVDAVFFSLDDTRKIIINRLVALKSGLEINAIQKPSSLKESDKAERKKTYQYFKNLKVRLNIIEDVENFDDLKQYLNNYTNDKKRKNVVIFIDGLYLLDIDSKATSGTDRNSINEERANKIKEICCYV